MTWSEVARYNSHYYQEYTKLNLAANATAKKKFNQFYKLVSPNILVEITPLFTKYLGQETAKKPLWFRVNLSTSVSLAVKYYFESLSYSLLHITEIRDKIPLLSITSYIQQNPFRMDFCLKFLI